MRRLRLITTAVIVATAACALPRATKPAQEAPTASRERTFAYLGAHTRLFTEPDVSTSFKTTDRSDAPLDRQRFVSFVEVVGREGPWLEVVTLSPTDDGVPRACTTYTQFSGLRLHFFVRESELQPVLRADRRLHWPDGTQITLRKGLPLIELPGPESFPDKKLYWVVYDGLHFTVPVRADSVGRTYTGSAGVFEPLKSGRYLPNYEVDPDNVGPDGSARYRKTTRGLRYDNLAIQFVNQFSDPVFVTDEVPTSRGLLLSIRRRCFAARGYADPDWPQDFEPGGGGGLLGTVRSAEHHTFPAGTDLFWSDGRLAGTTVAEVSLSEEIDASGNRRCFVKTLHPTHGMTETGSRRLEIAEEGRLVLCADS